MKKLFSLLIVFISIKCLGQVYQVLPQYGYEMKRVNATLVLLLPSDTVTNKTGVARIGTVLYSGNGTKWTPATATDTTSLSNRINLKLNISDTAAMLSNYAKTSAVNLKVNISDTAAMLSNYAKTSVVNSGLALKVNISDTATMLSPYARTVNVRAIIADSLGGLQRLKALSAAGAGIYSNSGTKVAEWGLGGGANFDFHGFAGYDINRAGSYTVRSFTDKNYVDSAISASPSGTVTSVATNTGSGITGGTITTTGTLAIDTIVISTRKWRQKGIDSVQANLTTGLALKVNIADTASMLSTYFRKVDTASLSNRINLKANINSPTFTGTVGGITQSMVGLGNVTNESKATMFTNATFTGTFATAAGAIGNASLANGAVANLSGTNTGDQTTITGNAATATALQTARTIGTTTGDATSAGSTFDGTANNTNALTLATVNSNVGSFGSATQSPTYTVNGKGLITAAANVTITPAVGSISGLGTGVATALGVNTGSAGAVVLFNGDAGTPSALVGTNITGTASLNINGTVGATTATTGAFTTATASTSVRTPLLIGGTTTTSPLTFKTTTGVGATGARHIFQVGNNGATEAMTILNNANVGIGINSPTSKFQVFDSTVFAYSASPNVSAKIGASGTGGSFIVNTPSANSTFESGLAIDGTYTGGKTVVNLNAFGVYSGGPYSADLAFKTSTTTTLSEKMRLTNTGNLLIGTTTDAASSILNLTSTTKGFLLPRMTTTERNAIASPATGLSIFNTTLNTNDTYDGTQWQRFGASTSITGTAAISTSLTTPLLIGGTTTTSTITYQPTSGVGTTGADHIFKVGNNGATEAMRILNNGNVGIGTTPTGVNGKLQVSGSIGLSGNSEIRQNTNGDGSTLKILATQLVVGSSNSGGYGYSGGGLIAPVSASDALLLLDAGRTTSTDGRFKLANTTSSNTSLSLEKNSVTTLFASTNGTVGVGTATPAASSILDVTSTTKGFLPPRMTTTEINAIVSPAAGLVVYNTTLTVLCFYDGTAWKKVSHSAM